MRDRQERKMNERQRERERDGYFKLEHEMIFPNSNFRNSNSA